MLHDITLQTKPFSYSTNMIHAEVRIELAFNRHAYELSMYIEMWSWSLIMRDDLFGGAFIFDFRNLCASLSTQAFCLVHHMGLFWNDFHWILSLI